MINNFRVSYIDNLKGFAILWVIMGHVAEKSIGLCQTPFNCFYSSFHMPLFMFLSGLFAFKSFNHCSLSEYKVFYKKKLLRIIVPFVVIGGGILH